MASQAGVRSSIQHPKQYCDVNIKGFIHILEECVKNNIKQIVYASSSSVYGLNTKVPFSEEDKIKRWIGACQKYNIETLISCDGDDPFIDLGIGEKCANVLETEKGCIVEAKNLPCGSFTYAINSKSLLRIANHFDTSRSEMIDYFFKKDKNSKYILFDPQLSYEGLDVNNIRITIDFIEDMIMARKLAKILKEDNLKGTAQEIINIYRKKPEIFSINQYRQIEFKENQQNIVDTYK